MVLARSTALDFSSTVWALVIGVDKVASDWLPHLPAPEREAASVAAALTSAEGCGLSHDQVICLTGSHATREACLTAMQQIIDSLEPESSLLVYFAGHGVAKSDDFYPCTADALPDELSTTALSGSDLDRMFGDLTCRGLVVVLDCCEGGTFAGAAPKVFREFAKGEYRILLASARPGQRSWESTDGRGTLFSRHFIDAIDGKLIVGDIPGAIYFSDLVQGIDNAINEELRGQEASQDMMMAAVYVRDPLILVHRSLSLRRVQFATARYSPSHVRRRIYRVISSIAFLLFFTVTTAYGVLDNTEYVRQEGDSLAIFRGHPEWNLPGYPRRLWTFEFGIEGLAPGTQIESMVTTGNNSLAELLESRLGPRETLSFASGLRAGAVTDRLTRELALKVMNDPQQSPEAHDAAKIAFVGVALKSDAPLLEEMLQQPERSDVSVGALVGLIRLNDSSRLNANLDDFFASNGAFALNRILDGIDFPCTPALDHFLSDLLADRGVSFDVSDILVVALRAECRLSETSLKAAMSRDLRLTGLNIYRFAEVSGRGETILDFAINTSTNSKGGPLLSSYEVLAIVDQAPCPQKARKVAPEDPTYSALVLMLARKRHCRNYGITIEWDTSRSLLILKSNTDSGFTDIAELKAAIPGERAVFELLQASLSPQESESLLLPLQAILKQAKEPYEKAEALLRMHSFGFHVNVPLAWYDSNLFNLQEAATFHLVAKKPGALVDLTIGRLDVRRNASQSLLGQIDMSERQLSKLRMRLDAGQSATTHWMAACLLAMRSRSDEALELLTSKESRVRAGARECVTFNDSAEEILTRLPVRVNGFPLEGRKKMVLEVVRKSHLKQVIRNLPSHAQMWYLKMMGEQRDGPALSQGLRVWIAMEMNARIKKLLNERKPPQMVN